MEILMKLKCSTPTPGGTAPSHSTLKIVDHHHQLQQKHTLVHGQPRPARAPPQAAQELLLPAGCLEYTTAATAMNCCSGADLHWEQQRHHGMLIAPGGLCSGGPMCSADQTRNAGCCGGGGSGAFESPACCSGGLSRCNFTTPPPPPPPLLLAPPPPPPLVMMSEPAQLMGGGSLETFAASESCQMPRYEYHEPEENFVSIDDARIEGFLMRMGRQQEGAKQRKAQAEQDKQESKAQPPATIVYEIIDLDDEEEREKLKRIKNQVEARQAEAQPPPAIEPPRMRSTDISLIPKSPERRGKRRWGGDASKEKIVAEIDLLDSSDEENNDDQSKDVENDEERTKSPNGDQEAGQSVETEANEETEDDDEEELPFAAAAVSCELDCDDVDDDVGDDQDNGGGHEENAGGIVILPSDDDDENMDFIDEQEEGQELRWDDIEEQKERTFFECFLCSKKVQSSYNLRRHMMIHTGERPFGCDLCDRRFREFSDLKKHRRRHAHEAHYVCMVCRVNSPTDSDPTRCSSCKTGAVVAASRLQLPSSPEVSRTPPPPPHTPSPAPSTSSAPASPPPPKGSEPPPPPPLPPLIPINPAIADTQLLLDNIPAVHRRSHDQRGGGTRREFPCPLCQRPFGTRHNLKRHFMIHTGEKPFACSKCRKPFREYSTLKKHMVTHARDRWYKCLRCPLKYRDYLEYMAHRRTHPSEAETCSSNASGSNTPTPTPKKRTRTARQAHDDSHEDSGDEDSASDDCWLECCECGQRYTDIESYTEHLREHDPALFLYECYICKRTFAERDELVRHLAQHGVEATFERAKTEWTEQDDNETTSLLRSSVRSKAKLAKRKINTVR